nr:MAG TPA: hypothetical protein [Caudoviricetes sp.]
MAKYKVGDKVRIVSERPDSRSYVDEMVRFLGKEITISMVKEFCGIPYYYSEDAKPENPIQQWYCKRLGVPGYFFMDEWISGLAEQKKPADENLSVTIRFCGRMTVAELYKNGRVVKVENARCNPKDTYSRSEGARVAVERLFEKKRKENKTKESKPKIGDKFVIVGKSRYHGFSIGETVRLIRICEQGKRYENCRGLGQWVCDSDVKPYKEKAK